MAEGESSDNMKKGKGIPHGFKIVGQGLKGDADHPEVTGVDKLQRGPGRPPKNDDTFNVVGPSVEQEQQGKSD